MFPLRKILILPLLFSLLLLGCGGKHHYPTVLLMADSLCEVNPKAAIDTLDRLEKPMAQAPEPDRMYYRLLRIKAADKAYIPHTSDSLIRTVLDYYEHGGDPSLLPTAYYYGGRVNMDLGDAPQAIDYYRKALDAMPTDSCSPLRGKVQHQLGRLYWDQHVNQEALFYYQESLKSSCYMRDTADVIFNMEALAGVCEDKNLTDSALFFYQSAYLLSEQFQDTILKSDICTQLARFYISMGDNEHAKPYMQFSLQHIDEDNLSAVYGMASKYYMALHQIDSAIYYSQLELARPNIFSKEGGSRHLTDLYIQQGDLKKANEYIALYKLYNDSVRGRRAAEDVARVNALYNQHVNEQKIWLLQLNDANKTKWLVIIISAFILSSTFSFRMLSNYKKRIKKSKEREAGVKRVLEQLRTSSQERIDLEKQKLIEMRSQLDTLRLQSSQTEDELQKREVQIKVLEEKVHLWETERKRKEQITNLIKNTANYHLLIDLLNKGKFPTKEEWKETEDNVLHFYPSFKNEIEKYVILNETEYHVCLLLKMKFQPSQIQILINRSREAVTAIRRRLFEKAFGKNEKGKPADWDRFIESIN